MEHHMAQTQAWRPCVTSTSFSQKAQPLSCQPRIGGLPCSETNGSQLDLAGASTEVPSGRKRSGPKRTRNEEESKRRKNENCKKYRKKHKDEFQKLWELAQKFGGPEKMDQKINEMEARSEKMDQKINDMEAKLRTLEVIEQQFRQKVNETEAKLRGLNGIGQEFHMHQQMATEFHRPEKFDGIEEMDSKLPRFNQINSTIREIHGIVPEINGPTNIFQYIPNKQMESSNHQNAQHTDYHGTQSQVQGSTIDWLEGYEISQMFPAAALGTVPDLVYSAAGLNEFIAQFDEYEMSNIRLYGFNNLHGECQIVGDYTFTQPLDCSANDIFNTEHSDATRNDQSTFNWAFTNNQFDWLLG